MPGRTHKDAFRSRGNPTTTPRLADNCLHVFLDVGANRGVHMRCSHQHTRPGERGSRRPADSLRWQVPPRAAGLPRGAVRRLGLLLRGLRTTLPERLARLRLWLRAQPRARGAPRAAGAALRRAAAAHASSDCNSLAPTIDIWKGTDLGNTLYGRCMILCRVQYSNSKMSRGGGDNCHT